MKEIVIYEFQLKSIVEALRLTNNLHECLKGETFELAKTNAIICIKRMLNNRVSYPYPQEINVEINGIINMINYPTVFWTKVLDIVKELKSI